MSPNNASRGFAPLNWIPRRARSAFHCEISCDEACFRPAPNNSSNEPFAAILNRRISRRSLVRATIAGAPLLALSTSPLGSQIFGSAPLSGKADAASSTIGLQSIPHDNEDSINIAEGYSSNVVIRWGDAVVPGAPAFNLNGQTAESAAKQFGFNCDYNGFFPLLPGQSRRGLLGVNHEYTSGVDMFPGYDADDVTAEQAAIEIVSHGLSVVEVTRGEDGSWSYDASSSHNFRITGETPMRLTGPGAGSVYTITNADPTGVDVLGMLNNCSGGRTPWGTILTAEENFNQYFANAGEDTRAARYGIPEAGSRRHWEDFYDRFDMNIEPNEPNRHGYLVEIDPYDPSFTPRKHTAMGRFKHEAASVTLSDDGRAVVYSGDDQRFDYVYKFISNDRYNIFSRSANLDLLSSGTLFAAKFNDDGSGEWLPLVAGSPPLHTWTNAGIATFTRLAADAVGATPMDRPEDIEVNPINHRVYIALTNNTQRAEDAVNGANPRGPNTHGHILEVTENGGDAASRRFTWDIFILCGDPSDSEQETYFAGFDKSELDSISAPDNLAVDANANLWISTDGQPSKLGQADAIYVVPTAGPERGRIRRFMTGVPDGEMAGPEFTPDFGTLFVSVQHPGEAGGLDEPTSTWPDGEFPRPSVVEAYKDDG
ncbi:MAG: PhoX family phosphatase, partial [Chloroflexi bacterium]|nr:PhoX family phosphatase [Chloroflexota bacterium]